MNDNSLTKLVGKGGVFFGIFGLLVWEMSKEFGGVDKSVLMIAGVVAAFTAAMV